MNPNHQGTFRTVLQLCAVGLPLLLIAPKHADAAKRVESATTGPATDTAAMTATSSHVAELPLPTADVSVPALFAPLPAIAPLMFDARDGYRVASPPGLFQAPKDDVLALSYSCTKTGFCCFWFREDRSPYCG